VLATGERRITGSAPYTGGGSGEQDCAAFPGNHDLGGFPSSEEAAQRAHLPDLGVNAAGRFADRKADVATYVKRHDLDRADVAFDHVKQPGDFLFVAGVAAEGAGLAAVLFDPLDQGCQFVAMTAGDACEKALTREAAGDGATGRIPGTNNQRDSCFRHGQHLPRLC
jgi:hypothetical protein